MLKGDALRTYLAIHMGGLCVCILKGEHVTMQQAVRTVTDHGADYFLRTIGEAAGTGYVGRDDYEFRRLVADSVAAEPACAEWLAEIFRHARVAWGLEGPPPVRLVRVEYDGFEGEVIGQYITREGKSGVVVQQVGTRVVHVYGRNRVLSCGAG
jgi:hypothetical protein